MATAKYKYVKMVAPGGAVLNFIGIAGTTPEVVLNTDLIKKCIKLGVAVFEIKETEEEILGTKQIKKEFIPLTLKKKQNLAKLKRKSVSKKSMVKMVVKLLMKLKLNPFLI